MSELPPPSVGRAAVGSARIFDGCTTFSAAGVFEGRSMVTARICCVSVGVGVAVAVGVKVDVGDGVAVAGKPPPSAAGAAKTGPARTERSRRQTNAKVLLFTLFVRLFCYSCHHTTIWLLGGPASALRYARRGR